MKSKRYTEEQIIRILGLVESGNPVASVCRQYGVSEASVHRWRGKYKGMDQASLKRLRELETEIKVIDTLEWLGLVRGMPSHIRSDNGPEFVAKAIQQWLQENHCQTIYIKRGSPWENPYIESFNGKCREECLDRYAFANGREAQEIITGWREEYNQYRPHSSLGYQTPAEFAASVVCPLDLRDNAKLEPKTLILTGA